MRGKTNIATMAAVVAAVMGMTASAFSRRRPYDGFIGNRTLRQRHDTEKVRAAEAKRTFRKARDLRIAARGGIGMAA